jgi:hypothetical protein
MDWGAAASIIATADSLLLAEKEKRFSLLLGYISSLKGLMPQCRKHHPLQLKREYGADDFSNICANTCLISLR